LAALATIVLLTPWTPDPVSHVSAQPWTVARTSWGDPDFGGRWEFATMTPLERPRGVETPVFTDAEAAGFEGRTRERQRAVNVNGPDWWDAGSGQLDDRRTSLLVDPADGRLPPLTPDAARAVAQRPPAGRPAVGPEDFSLFTRCLHSVSVGPPMLPMPYNNNVAFMQTPDHVAIVSENVPNVRIVPLGDRPHGATRQWLGDSRGRWEGDTLVIDTVSFNNKVRFRGVSGEHLHVIERFTRTGSDRIEYRFTAEDPTVWTKPWTAVFSMRRTADRMYEFACHEGNHRFMEGLLRTARMMDRAAP
jgi:hypothetical protein